MTSLQLYLKDGKWFDKESGLEVSNPEVAFEKKRSGNLWRDNQTKEVVIPGVLYPWEGEWEIVDKPKEMRKYLEGVGQQCEYLNCHCNDIKNCRKNNFVLRLLLKSPVKDKHEIWRSGQWILVTESDYEHAINNNHYGRINGVLQHGDPESPVTDYTLERPSEDGEGVIGTVRGAGDDYPVIDHAHHTAPTVKTYVPRIATTEYRRRTTEETIEHFLKDQEDEQQEIWNEVLSTCEQHVINDIRLMEKLSKLYTIIRKS